MLRSLLLFVLDWLRVKLDPEFGARIEAYKAERRAQEQQVELLKGDILAGETQIGELQQLRAKIHLQVAADAEDLKVIDAKLERVKDAKPGSVLSDADAVRADF